MQARMVRMTAQRKTALRGFRCLGLTSLKNLGNGVALSRARVQNTRLAVIKTPRSAIIFGRIAMMSRPRVPPAEPVACW